MSDNIPVYGVMGAGSFGSVIANLLAKNGKVYLFTQRTDAVLAINSGKGNIKGVVINPEIKAISDPKAFVQKCPVIFPVVRSKDFRRKIKKIAPYLTPAHIIIHGVKGFDVNSIPIEEISVDTKIDKALVQTMSQVVLEETVVKRVGCFSGPNLSGEINEGQLAATVIASRFNEVISVGKRALSNANFKVFSNPDILAVELTGVLKNIMAIASGAIHGLGYGENAKAMLISRGLAEMVWMGRTLGFSPNAFLGVAGIGDLVATCSSPKSRNFSLGYNIAQGESVSAILNNMKDVAEGVGTVKIINGLSNQYGFRAPITQTLFKILFEHMPIEQGIDYLMHFPLHKDVEFLEASQ